MNSRKKEWGAWFIILSVIAYMGFLLIAPILALIRGAFHNGLSEIWRSISTVDFFQALQLSLVISVVVVTIQLFFGTFIAWVIVRNEFVIKPIMNNIIDIPFAISPVVVGYMLLLLFGRNGLLDPILERLNIQVAFATPGMVFATLFVCLPFMIREMIPVIKNLDQQQERAAATLGANRWIVFWKIIFPQLKSGIIYGMTLTLARALGEFGAVLVIGGGIQGRTETATLFIFRCLEERKFIPAYTMSIFLGMFSVIIVLLGERVKKQSTDHQVELS